MSELSSWLERPVEEDWKDVEKVLLHYGVNPWLEILKEAWQRKVERYSGVFPPGKTRIMGNVPQTIDVPWGRSTLLHAFLRAQIDLKVPRSIYDKAALLAGAYTNEEIVRNRTRDGQRLLRLILKDVPEHERAEVEMVWSRAIRSFRRSACTMVWSISPLDILLQSMAGICSCHSLDDGGHRGGAVAYMTDAATSIFYTTNTLRAFADLNGLRVPEKGWRALCFYEPGEGVRLQREYPHESSDYVREADKLILERTEEWTLKGVIPGIDYESEAPYIDAAVLGHCTSNRSSTITGIANGVCPECGRRMDSAENLSCSRCESSVYCDACHEQIRAHETYHTVGSRTLCDDCYDYLTVECHHCGEAVWADTAYTIHGHEYCRTCADELFAVCWECGADVPNEEAIEVDGRLYCPDCTVYCSGCHRDVLKRTAEASPSGRWFCSECREKHFEECQECGQLIPRDEILLFFPTHDEWSWLRVCDDCFDRLSQETTLECAECGREFPIAEMHRWLLNREPHERFCRECLEKLADAHRRQLAH